MKETMKTAAASALGTLAVALILAIAGYVLVVRDNQKDIQALLGSLGELKIENREARKSLNAAHLRITAAHGMAGAPNIEALDQVLSLPPAKVQEFVRDIQAKASKGGLTYDDLERLGATYEVSSAEARELAKAVEEGGTDRVAPQ